jgi:hypothetical protein
MTLPPAPPATAPRGPPPVLGGVSPPPHNGGAAGLLELGTTTFDRDGKPTAYPT